MTEETKAKQKIKKYLSGLSEAHFFSVPVTGYNTHGIADILGCYKGMFVAIEVKSPAAYARKDFGLSPLQQKYRDKIHAAGGLYLAVDSAERVCDMLDAFI